MILDVNVFYVDKFCIMMLMKNDFVKVEVEYVKFVLYMFQRNRFNGECMFIIGEYIRLVYFIGVRVIW